MTNQHTSDASRPTPTPNAMSGKWGRSLVGAGIGSSAGGLLGWLLDSALTSDPYAGVRVGLLVGGLCGGVVGVGAGWRGIGVVLSMLLCSAGGAALGLALCGPGPDSFLTLIPTFIGGILGAFIGLAVGGALIRRRQSGAPAD